MFYYNNTTNEDNSIAERRFSSFKNLREGDYEPVLGKIIKVLIENGGDFIVYLDPEMNIQYAVCPEYQSYSPFYGKVLNKVAELEGLADKSFMNRKQIREYRSMIGAAIARMYEHENKEIIFEMLEKSEYFLRSRVTETARIWYLLSASVTFLLLILSYFTTIQIFPITRKIELPFLSGILMGSAGSYLSLVMNSKKITVNPSSGRVIHFFESITRLLIGMIGGFFSALLFQSGVISIGVSEDSYMINLILSFAAGFSERIVPNMINKFEIIHPAEYEQQNHIIHKKE